MTGMDSTVVRAGKLFFAGLFVAVVDIGIFCFRSVIAASVVVFALVKFSSTRQTSIIVMTVIIRTIRECVAFCFSSEESYRGNGPNVCRRSS